MSDVEVHVKVARKKRWLLGERFAEAFPLSQGNVVPASSVGLALIGSSPSQLWYRPSRHV